MIIEKDFIMREVQKMVQVLQVIMGLKQEKKYVQAQDKIDDIYARFFDENMQTIQAKDDEGLERLCTIDGRFSPDLAFALADIINQEAEILELQGDKKAALQQYKSSLKLYQQALEKKDATVPVDVMDKMQRIEGKLKE